MVNTQAIATMVNTHAIAKMESQIGQIATHLGDPSDPKSKLTLVTKLLMPS